ncbi:MAG: HupE/UreJ family protein [Pseudomonadota bacterium]
MNIARIICLPLFFLAAAASAHTARAHEVRPAIADVVIADTSAQLTISLALEGFIAGIDLAEVKNTNDAANNATYDTLRALPPTELTSRLRAYWPIMQRNFAIRGADGTVIAPRLIDVSVPEVGNPELARISTLTIAADGRAPFRIGWAREYGALIVRQQGVPEDAAYTDYLRAGEASPALTATGSVQQSALDVFVRYIAVGFDHIIPKGLDHILFILGLFFLAPRITTLLWQVTAFTLAHSVTLALGALGWVSVPGNIVEPLIAASIVFVALENVFTDALSRWRPALIFAFGLLHGLGFASVLEEFGLPDAQFIPALIGFNVGVEVGQLAVIAVAFLLVGIWFRSKSWYRPGIAIPASLVIAAIGAYWVYERTLA